MEQFLTTDRPRPDWRRGPVLFAELLLDSDNFFDVFIAHAIHVIVQVHGCVAVVNPQFDLPAGLQAFRRVLNFNETMNGM
jgi:hypothetical protein